jgi:hypothetical protein
MTTTQKIGARHVSGWTETRAEGNIIRKKKRKYDRKKK